MLMSQIENESQPQEERSLLGFLTGVALLRRHLKKLLRMFFLSSSKPSQLLLMCIYLSCRLHQFFSMSSAEKIIMFQKHWWSKRKNTFFNEKPQSQCSKVEVPGDQECHWCQWSPRLRKTEPEKEIINKTPHELVNLKTMLKLLLTPMLKLKQTNSSWATLVLRPSCLDWAAK